MRLLRGPKSDVVCVERNAGGKRGGEAKGGWSDSSIRPAQGQTFQFPTPTSKEEENEGYSQLFKVLETPITGVAAR